MQADVQTCRPEDLPALRPLYAALYSDQPTERHEPLSARLSDFFLVAQVDGQIVGFVIGAKGPVDIIGTEMAREAFPGQKEYLEIQDLYVMDSWRNQGIGSLLMRRVIQRGLKAGLKRSMVYTNKPDYARIGRFYERFGYRIDHLFMKR